MSKSVVNGFRMSWTVLLWPILLTAYAMAGAAVQVYPAPAGEPLSRRFTVTVEKQSVPVYLGKSSVIAMLAKPTISQAGEVAFASFDMSGSVEVTVTTPGPIQQAKILPTSSGITPKVSGNHITFTVTTPAPLTVEVNGDWNNSLEVFANPMETNVPRANDPNVIYFGPGVHTISPLKVGSGKTVYVAGGAVVYGKLGPEDKDGPVIAVDGSNVTIRGRGVIDGSLYTRPVPSGHILRVHGQNIHVEGLVFRDSMNWTFPIVQSQAVTVDNLKILGSRPNSDGIDILNSRNVQVSNSFFRTFDDLIVVKTLTQGGNESRDITVKHTVLWNEVAHALSVGAEVRQNIENVQFSDCDIIHDKGRDWLLGVLNSDGGTVSQISFDDIRVEESRRLIFLWIGKTLWSQGNDRGNIANITFRNIRSASPEDMAHAAEFTGFDAQHLIRGVQVENVTIGGRPLNVGTIVQNQFVQGASVRP